MSSPVGDSLADMAKVVIERGGEVTFGTPGHVSALRQENEHLKQENVRLGRELSECTKVYKDAQNELLRRSDAISGENNCEPYGSDLEHNFCVKCPDRGARMSSLLSVVWCSTHGTLF